MLREQDKHFLWSIYSAIAIIFTWKGLWEGIYQIPYFGDPFIFLFIGFAMLTFSSLIFNEFDPLGGLEKAVSRIVKKIEAHPQKGQFQITYYDKNLKKELSLPGTRVVKFEKGALIFRHPQKNEEIFVPMHRLRTIYFQGKRFWRL
ncbi:MAG TPA: RNA repair domain-containing protein [Candidatus Nanoarchaeia archaeon]|nr:RNA repair domain-containing protein [Candidatus Nanoarchaeia archaeon]